MAEYLGTGRTASKPRGGDRRSGRIEAQADLLLAAIEAAPDITLAELREKLIAERGETFAIIEIGGGRSIGGKRAAHPIGFRSSALAPAV